MKEVLMTMLILFSVSYCTTTSELSVKKRAQLAGINLHKTRVGVSCLYAGMLGDNSEDIAKSNGMIRYSLFKYTDGNFFKRCTWVYGL